MNAFKRILCIASQNAMVITTLPVDALKDHRIASSQPLGSMKVVLWRVNSHPTANYSLSEMLT